jgi:hypothetical protein
MIQKLHSKLFFIYSIIILLLNNQLKSILDDTKFSIYIPLLEDITLEKKDNNQYSAIIKDKEIPLTEIKIDE